MKTLKRKSVFLIALLTVLSIGIYSCKDEDDDDDGIVVSQVDRDFARNVSNSNNAEIEFGQLAMQKSDNDSILSYAQRMVDDHTAAQNRLDSIADDLDIQLSDSLDAAHSSLLDSLTMMDGFAFDSVYINSQVMDHQATRTLLQNHIDNGENDELVEYASDQLPVINMHLQDAIEIRSSLVDTTATDNGDNN